MRFSFLVSWAALAVGAYAQSSSADAYVASESPIAKAGVIANIGPSGSKSSGAKVSGGHPFLATGCLDMYMLTPDRFRASV